MRVVIVRLALLVTALCYYIAFAFSFRTKRARQKKFVRLQNVFYTVGLLINFGMVVYNFVINLVTNGVGYAPFVSMFQVLIFLALCFFPVYLFIEKVCACVGYSRYFLLASAVVMTGPCFMDIADVWTFPPALQSVFFVPHIVCYMLSYSLAAIAFMITVTALLKGENHDRVCVLCLRTLFPFMSLGMFLGAIWADQVWGDFWAWDVKEGWSLCTWLTYMLALHFYRREKLKRYARVLVIAGFVLVVITFLFSNVFKVDSVHSY